MAVKKTKQSRAEGGIVIQLHLIGIIVFSAALVLTSVLVTYGLASFRPAGKKPLADPSPPDPVSLAEPAVTEGRNPPAWGQLQTRDIDLEQPEEYVAYQLDKQQVETWIFPGMTPDQVRATMQSCGVGDKGIDRALSPACLTARSPDTIITPDSELVFSLSPAVRAKLYDVLAQFPVNEFMYFPFSFVGNNFDEKFGGGRVPDTVVASLKKLLYPRGGTQRFSDLGILLQQVPDEKERLTLLKVLSCQSAVLARINIWPDTDVDKLIGYWNRGLQLKDIRPLLESLRNVPEGASVSILYFLPQFARQRLYTFPRPSQPGDPVMDCHWSTMNFFNETPDNHFTDTRYTAAYLQANYYQIAKPSAYGDLVFLLNRDGNAIHSAVYLADDLVFTKNGNNISQPWMLMHLKDLLAEYATDETPRMAVYRNKNW